MPPAALASSRRRWAKATLWGEQRTPIWTDAHIPEQAARARPDDCEHRGWCGHTGSDGADIKARVVRSGYEGSGWAECWAQTQSAQRAVEVWMDETPPNDSHRCTLLSDWLTELGIGVSEADWGTYIIADFGRP